MVRVTRSVARKRRINRLLKQAKGFVGDRKNHHRLTRDALMKAWSYAFKGRKEKKRCMKSIWIQRINAACRCHGISYSKFIDGLTQAKIEIDRKILSSLTNDDPKAFEVIVDKAKQALEAV